MSTAKRILQHTIAPAYACPLDNGNATIVWPYKESEAFVILAARFDQVERVIVIEDLAAIMTLTKMGYFGLASSKEINYYHVREALIRSGRSDQVSTLTLGSYEDAQFDIPKAMESFALDMNHAIDSMKMENKTEHPEASVANLSSLKLCLEEAYFLSYVLGMLIAETKQENKSIPLPLDQLWSLSCETINKEQAEEFAARYAAYHYFRSKGWVVRTGDKFGCDWLLYKEGPSFYHALYAMVVRWRRGVSGELQHRRQTSWREVGCMTRMLHSAQKKLVYAIVTIPEGKTSQMITSEGPACIKDFAIELLQISRNDITRRVYQNNQ